MEYILRIKNNKNLWKSLFLGCFFLLFSPFIFSQSGRFKVVLDAGHGGKDPGKVYGKIYEKNIVLNIVRSVGKALEQDPDFQVFYTRKTDKFIELYERGHIANKAKADLFVSVHCNAANNTRVYGAETYVLGLHANEKNFDVAKEENQVIYLEENYQERYAGYDINSPESFIGLSIMQEEFLEQSIQMAKNVQSSLKKELSRSDRGVKQAGFIVLHQTYMPSVLIETGFLTNANERSFLTSEKGQQQIAQSIVSAIKKYRLWIKNNSSQMVVQPKTPANPNIFYKVQIATSKRNLEPKAANFRGLSPISKEPINQLFRYYFGKENLLENAQRLQQVAKERGYKDAFIVPFVNGERKTMEDLQK